MGNEEMALDGEAAEEALVDWGRWMRNFRGAVCAIDVLGVIRDASPAFAQLARGEPRQLVGRALSSALGPCDPSGRALLRAGSESLAAAVRPLVATPLTMTLLGRHSPTYRVAVWPLPSDAGERPTGAILHFEEHLHIVARRGAGPTPRERAVLELLAIGRTNREIGEQLGVREFTARNHVSALLRKLCSSNRLEAVASARQRGWI